MPVEIRELTWNSALVSNNLASHRVPLLALPEKPKVHGWNAPPPWYHRSAGPVPQNDHRHQSAERARGGRLPHRAHRRCGRRWKQTDWAPAPAGTLPRSSPRRWRERTRVRRCGRDRRPGRRSTLAGNPHRVLALSTAPCHFTAWGMFYWRVPVLMHNQACIWPGEFWRETLGSS